MCAQTLSGKNPKEDVPSSFDKANNLQCFLFFLGKKGNKNCTLKMKIRTKICPLYAPLCSPSSFSVQFGLEKWISLSFCVLCKKKIWKVHMEISFITEIVSCCTEMWKRELSWKPDHASHIMRKGCHEDYRCFRYNSSKVKSPSPREWREEEKMAWRAKQLSSNVEKLEKLMLLSIAHWQPVFLNSMRVHLLGKSSQTLSEEGCHQHRLESTA